MSVQPSTPLAAAQAPVEPEAHPRTDRRARRRARRRVIFRHALRVAALVFAFAILGSDGISYTTSVRLQIRAATAGWAFDLTGWEARALADKGAALVEQPARGLAEAEGAGLVRAYLRRAADIRRLEAELTEAVSQGAAPASAEVAHIEEPLARLRAEQGAARPAAEAVIQRQIAATLEEADLGLGSAVLPPVLFTFSESPRKLVVSPRARITTAHWRMLEDAMPLDQITRIEQEIEAGGAYSAYVARTGGLGAFPTMVIDDASLPWLLSTVAHEWVHTYLTFFPLGFNYGRTQANTTINETVADLVGDEIGRRALARYYPDLVLPDVVAELPPLTPNPRLDPDASPPFDFNAEMAETRRVADLILAEGRIDDAETYMEQRRQLFVANGYHLRRLNQAYFAFHGSYGTGPAADVSTPDAVAPKVQALYDRSTDLRDFLQRIRSVVDVNDLDRLLQP